MSNCDQSEALRDYAFDELPGAGRVAIERHIETCGACAADLHAIRLTTATLRSVPDRDIPQRIAFVSDKLFEPSPWVRMARAFFGSPTQVGFAAACLLAAAIFFSPVRQPAETGTAITRAASAEISQQDVSRQIEAAVRKAVVQVREEDTRATQMALAAAEIRHQREHSALMVTMQETMDVMQKRMGTYTSLASLEAPSAGSGQ